MKSNPSIEDQVEFYDHWNSQYRSERYEDIDVDIKARAEKILSVIEAQKIATAEILEVGCGTGWFTGKLCDLGSVTAVDLSPQAIELAKRREPRAQFTACNIFEHDFAEKRFDLVVCVETLFYVEDAQLLVQKMAELCKDGGCLAVTTINKFVYDRRSDIPPPDKGQIRNWMTRGKTRGLIQRCFDVELESTIEPQGDQGVLRLVNSNKVNHLLERFIDRTTIKNAKEKLGLGGGVVLIARKKGSGW